MKRTVKIICIVLTVAVMALFLAACSDHGAPAHDVSQPRYVISPDTLANKLDAFIGEDRKDRTSFSAEEKKAAEYIVGELVDYGYTDIAAKPFSTTESNVKDLISRNVVAEYRPEGLPEHPKNVIIGANYDNRFKVPYTGGLGGTGAEGALCNGTGVATLLAIAEYLQTEKPALGFTVTLAFFGASAVRNTGVNYYYENEMSVEHRSDTVLMIELQRLGVDHVYAFCDARETRREGFFDTVAKANSLDIYKITQKSPVMMGWRALEDIPYSQWAMSGCFQTFFNKGIPTLNLIGANWETIDLSDNETAHGDDLELTRFDTIADLKKSHPDYAKKMAAAATLVLDGLTSADFLSTMEYDHSNFPDTSVLAKDWIWPLIALGIVIVAALILMLVNSVIVKKNPPDVPRPKKMRMAVFGMDYEDPEPDSIYIDIKPAAGPDEIFPGVPNNEPPPGGMPVGIFGLGDIIKPAAEPQKDGAGDIAADPFASPDGKEEPAPAPTGSAEAHAEPEKPAEQAEPGPEPTPEASEPAEPDKKPRAKPSAPKRASTAAKKSVGAGKSSSAGKTKKSEPDAQPDDTADKAE